MQVVLLLLLEQIDLKYGVDTLITFSIPAISVVLRRTVEVVAGTIGPLPHTIATIRTTYTCTV